MEVVTRCQILVVVPINRIMREPFTKMGKTVRETRFGGNIRGLVWGRLSLKYLLR